MSEPIAPEHCPEPGWHTTHRYCPVCTWTEPAPVTEQRLAELGGSDHIVQFFKYSHLPAHLAAVSERFAVLALVVLEVCPRNPERTIAFRKLLEAKDAAVRAVVAS
jgi:hypothetical protein